VSENILIAIALGRIRSRRARRQSHRLPLPGDIVARYIGLKGIRPRVSGTDRMERRCPGGRPGGSCPLSSQQGIPRWFLNMFRRLASATDLFTSHPYPESIFGSLRASSWRCKRTVPVKRTSQQWFSPSAPPGFCPTATVEGTCYHWRFAGVRSISSDNCGNVLEAEKLIAAPVPTGDGDLELRGHRTLLSQSLEARNRTSNAVPAPACRTTCATTSWCRSPWQDESEGLTGRPLTAILSTGIPVPTESPGWESNAYVWFARPLSGYLSAAIECSADGQTSGPGGKWWANSAAGQFYSNWDRTISLPHVSLPSELMGVASSSAEVFSDRTTRLTLRSTSPQINSINRRPRRSAVPKKWQSGRRFPQPLRSRSRRYYLTVNNAGEQGSDWDWSESWLATQ